jgi:hypothetical protein
MTPKFNGVSDNNVLAKRVSEVVESLESGEKVALREEPFFVRRKVASIIEAGEITKAEEEKLRRARIVTLMVNDDPETAVEGIKLSQKEHGVGNVPPVMQQFNFGETPEKMARLMEEVEGEDAKPNGTGD